MTRRRRVRRNKARKTYKTRKQLKQRGGLVALKQRGGLVALKQHGGLVALKQHGGLVALKQHGGLGQAYQIPPWAVVSASFQEPDYGVPVLMPYGEYRESLDNPIFDQEEPEKLNQPSPEKPIARLDQNAEHAGRKEVQVEQAFSGVQGSPSPRRRRTTNRSRSKGPR
jgi:hypothetical protein